MLAVQDDGSDLHYALWDGGAWGAPTEIETDTNEVKNQPFLFLWDRGTALPGADISGTIYEDINGDGSLIDGVGIGGVDVHLYLDDGDGVIDAGDTWVASTTTDAAGLFNFAPGADGTYWVVVDSTTITPDAGFNGGFGLGDVWAEQTWGSAGAVSFDGSYQLSRQRGRLLRRHAVRGVGRCIGADDSRARDARHRIGCDCHRCRFGIQLQRNHPNG